MEQFLCRGCGMVFKNGFLLRSVKPIKFNRFYSIKPTVKLDETVSKDIDNELFKPRNHPGRIKVKTVSVPETIVNAIQKVSEDHPIKKLVNGGKMLANYLHSRFPPIEETELSEVKRTVLADVLQKQKQTEHKTDEELERFEQSVKHKAQNHLRKVVYNWTSINFDAYTSLLYLHARFAPEYAVLVKIFYEIALKDKDFKPTSFFDFGSGTGTATWAANLYWKSSFFEYFNVDSSGDMNDLAQLLLQGGRLNVSGAKGSFYRQFLPATNTSYDLVVCAYSLLELPSLKTRLQTVLNLWNRTARYLVIVEQGTNAGFKVINQVRDFILDMRKEKSQGHVFSPCPHDMICPRFITDKTPCNFEVAYMPLPFGATANIRYEKYSYVVLKKGKRNDDDPQWPRIVRQPLVRSKHTICRLCTKSGKLDEIIFTASKHTKCTYYCARSSEWGDLLPVELEEKQ